MTQAIKGRDLPKKDYEGRIEQLIDYLAYARNQYRETANDEIKLRHREESLVATAKSEVLDCLVAKLENDFPQFGRGR